MQTFTKKFITFEKIEIFESFKKHCKVQEACFYGKNHELVGNKRNAQVWVVIRRFFERGKIQNFTKKFITFEKIKIFEFFKKHCKVQEAYFYGKNHELVGNKRNAQVCVVNRRFFERGKIQNFSKKFITFEKIETFEFFKKHCKVQEASFYGKNHELVGNKRNAQVWVVDRRFFERGKIQNFTNKFITFEKIEIFEFFKKHCKVPEAYFYEKNHELVGNKRNA